MRTKISVCVMILYLLLIINAQVSADWADDSPGDQEVPGYDILRAKAEAYPVIPDQIPENITFSLEMNSGSYLPGIVLFEVDVDNNTATGGLIGLTSLFNSCEGGTKIKPNTPGFDILILLMLRDQGDDAPTAWCDNCYTPEGQCLLRDQVCDCDQANCYTLGDYCNPGDLNCYLLGEVCSKFGMPCEEGGDYCSVMAEDCTAYVPCDMGRRIGEWYVSPGAAGEGGLLVDRGRIDMPLPKGTDTDDNDSYTFPWSRIVQAAYDQLEGNPKQFNLEAAKDVNNYKFHLSTWVDLDYATTENDHINISGIPCNEVSDVVPNTGKSTAQEGTTSSSTTTTIPVSAYWVDDLTGDQEVLGYDILKARAEAYPVIPDQIAENVTLSLEMNSKLPGIVIFEVDVDNNTATGGLIGLTSLFKSCEGGTKIKANTPGFDIAILLMLRDQGDTAETAWCDYCYGMDGQCNERDTACTGCVEPNCYQLGGGCTPGTPDCYIIGDDCTYCNEGGCFIMEEPCEATVPSGIGRIIGEWKAEPFTVLPLADWGRIDMPLPKGTDSDDKDSYTFPWARIVQAAHDQLSGDPKQFNLEAAKYINNYGFQVSAWYDPDYATTEDDFIDLNGSVCSEVSDVVPNTGKGGFDFDSDVDGIPDYEDNCPNHSNGPLQGTCVKNVGGVMMSYRVGDSFITCTSDDDCTATDGTCDMSQGNFNSSDCGDVCEGYADFNCDGEVGADDLSALQQSQCVGKTISYQNGCEEFEKYDTNDDGRVSNWDYIILKLHYGAHDLSLPPYCP